MTLVLSVAFKFNLRRYTEACMTFAAHMYFGRPYAREVGHVGEATSAGVMEGHDIPPDVLADVCYWLRMGGDDISAILDQFRREALEGAPYCYNDECEVMGHAKDFKVCPQCKTAMYCGSACQKQDWNAGGHKESCGTAASKKIHMPVRAPAP